MTWSYSNQRVLGLGLGEVEGKSFSKMCSFEADLILVCFTLNTFSLNCQTLNIVKMD